MYPEICKIGPVTVYSYGLTLVLAFLISTFLACREAKRQNLNPDTIFNFLFIAFISGIVGSRLFYVIENIGYYKNNLLEIAMLQRGGLSWFGGLILGISSGAVYIRGRHLPFFKTADLIMPYLALGQAIGRIGCLLNGCCYGKESEFGIYFPVHGAVLIPTQIYSSFILILIFIILRFIQQRSKKGGEVFFSYGLIYPAARFFIEFWRAEHKVILFGLNLFQILSILIFASSFLSLILIHKKKK